MAIRSRPYKHLPPDFWGVWEAFIDFVLSVNVSPVTVLALARRIARCNFWLIEFEPGDIRQSDLDVIKYSEDPDQVRLALHRLWEVVCELEIETSPLVSTIKITEFRLEIEPRMLEHPLVQLEPTSITFDLPLVDLSAEVPSPAHLAKVLKFRRGKSA